MLTLKTIPILFAALSLTVQTTPVQEPQNLGVVVYLNSANNSFADLEPQTAKIAVKTKALGFAGGSTVVELPGDKSPVRFSTKQQLQFVFSLATGVDPQKMTLYRFDSSKGKRTLVLAKAGSLGIGATSGPGPLRVNLTRYGDHSYKITSANPLTPQAPMMFTALALILPNKGSLHYPLHIFH